MRLDPFSQPYSRDPAATWRRMLATAAPVSYDPALGMWLIAGHDNVRSVLSDTTRFSNATTLAPVTDVSAAAGAILAGIDAPPVAVVADPPQHLRTRAIMRSLFPTTAFRADQQWGSVIEARVNELISGLEQRGNSVDLTHFAIHLPLQVIIDVLGLPTDAAADMRAWTDDFVQLVWGKPTPDNQVAYAHSAVALWRYCAEVVTVRADSGDHSDGLIGDLLRYRNNNDGNLTVAEVAALALSIVGAGWETSAGALGHALDHALTEPERWARLAGDEHYLSLHVEETLRHSPAIDGWLRQTITDVTVDGVTIPAGSRCLVLIGTANHDPAVYDRPSEFDPLRVRAGQHLAFGAGPHSCIGAALARLELTTALRALARRLPKLTLDGDYQRQFLPSVALRRHAALPVQLRPASRCPIADHNSSGAAH